MPGPARVGDDPLEADVVALLGGEGPEVVGSFHQSCRSLQEVLVQPLWCVTRVVALQRGSCFVVYYRVLVGPAPCVPTGVEIVRYGDAAAERHVLGQYCRGLVGDQGRTEVRLRFKGDDLPARVHPGVGAAGDAHLDLLAQDGREHLGEHTFYRPSFGLGCPTSEVGAVVLDESGEFQSRIPTSRTSAVTARASASALRKRSSR